MLDATPKYLANLTKAYKQLALGLCMVLIAGVSPLALANVDGSDDLTHYLPPGETRWLETQGNRYLLLERDSMQPITKGTALHIAAWNTHPLQSQALQASYAHLPNSGWNSLAIQPPTTVLSPDMLQFPAVDERYPEPVTEDTLNPLRESLRARLTPVFDELETAQGFVVLIVEGMSAPFLTDILRNDATANTGLYERVAPDAIVIIDGYLPQYSLNRDFAESLAQLNIPTLELTTYRASRWVDDQQGLRKQLANKHQHLSYRQIDIHGHGTLMRRQLTQSIEGWLRYQGF